jgi:hypothetical protein
MRVARLSDTMLPFTELMSIGGSADVNTSIFVMEASYRNVSGPRKPVTAVINSGRAVIADPTCESAWPLTPRIDLLSLHKRGAQRQGPVLAALFGHRGLSQRPPPKAAVWRHRGSRLTICAESHAA